MEQPDKKDEIIKAIHNCTTRGIAMSQFIISEDGTRWEVKSLPETSDTDWVISN